MSALEWGRHHVAGNNGGYDTSQRLDTIDVVPEVRRLEGAVGNEFAAIYTSMLDTASTADSKPDASWCLGTNASNFATGGGEGGRHAISMLNSHREPPHAWEFFCGAHTTNIQRQHQVAGYSGHRTGAVTTVAMMQALPAGPGAGGNNAQASSHSCHHGGAYL